MWVLRKTMVGFARQAAVQEWTWQGIAGFNEGEWIAAMLEN